jgi:hypothetical protein
MGSKPASKASQNDILARTMFLQQAMPRRSYSTRKSDEDDPNGRQPTVAMAALCQSPFALVFAQHDPVMKELYQPASRTQQPAQDAEMGKQGQDSRCFTIIASYDTKIVVEPKLTAPLALRTSTGAALSPERSVSSQAPRPSRPRQQLMCPESRKDCIASLNDVRVAKVTESIVYAWRTLPARLHQKSPLFATKANEAAVTASEEFAQLFNAFVVDPAERLHDEDVKTCSQRIGQELHQKLTFGAEMLVHVIELVYKAPGVESYRAIFDMTDSKTWWHDLTKWSSSLSLIDLNLSNYAIKDSSGETK